MEQWVYTVLAVAGAYLLGSIPFAVVVSRCMGLKDPRSYGSHNPGATNVLRTGNKIAAALTVVLDAAKGCVPIVLIRWYGAAYGLEIGTMAMAGLAAFLGHVYPIFLRFRGGKGVATALGVLLGIHWALGLVMLLVWAAVVAVTRYSSLGAISAAALAMPFYVLLSGLVWTAQVPLTLAILVMSLFLVWRHWGNINRLIAGAEPRIGAARANGHCVPVQQKYHHPHKKTRH